MDIKKIMFITFLLLAILTIGAVNADENVTSDDLKVSDDVCTPNDELNSPTYESDEYFIDVSEYEMCIAGRDYNKDEEVAYIVLPGDATKGSFRIINNGEVVARVDISDDEKYWEVDDEDGTLYGSIFLKDVNLTKIHDGDELSFQFLEYSSGQYVTVDWFTVVYKVNLTNSYMKLSEIGGKMDESDVDIQVSGIDMENMDENFTYVYVAKKEGIFTIFIEGVHDDIDIFKEDLNTTKRPYAITEDEYGDSYYRFAFSLNDINTFISRNITGVESFKDLVDNNIIASGNDVYFDLVDDEENEIYSKMMTLKISADGKILFEEEKVEIDYLISDIIMYENWRETQIIDLSVKKDVSGRIIIYLNDNMTPAFEKDLSQLTPVDFDEEDDFNYYTLTIKDLNITSAGEYILRLYVDDNEGEHIYHYDADDPEILRVFESQTVDVGGVTVDVDPIPKSVDDNETLITIDGTASAEDEVLIYVDGNQQAITIKLGDCKKDDTGNYIIESNDLNLGVGEHNLNITYKGVNLTAKVDLTTNIVIDFSKENETIYTTFNDVFVSIYLVGENIYTTNIDGNINLTVMDDGNIITTFEKEITDLNYEGSLESYVIRTNDLNAQLNGTYNVVVRYFGNKGTYQINSTLSFKAFGPEDYGASIEEVINDVDSSVITFNNTPLDYNIFVEINGNETVEFNKSDLNTGFNQDKKIYSIKYNQLKGFREGTNSIRVYIDTNAGYIDLAGGNVIVDLEKNIDPLLTISIADIEEGNAANAVITTNSTFTGEVIVQVANTNYSVNITNGQGSLSVNGLSPNTYTATVLFKSDGIFNDSIKTTTFKVTSKPAPQVQKADVVKLTLKKVKIKKSAKKLILQATLKINGVGKKGAKLTFKFNGKKYKVKTKKKGVAKVTISKKVLKKLKVGKKVKYQVSYGKTVKKLSAKVKK